jgi:hypothetical protein
MIRTFKKAETIAEHKKIGDMWGKAAEEMGYFNDKSPEFAELFAFLNEEQQEIGCVEFVKYNPEVYTSCELPKRGFMFSQLEQIKKHKDRTYEIDKLCFVSGIRNMGYLPNILDVFSFHQKQKNVKYYISLINSSFFKLLQKFYGVEVEQVGDPIPRKKGSMIPMVFDAESLTNEETYFRYRKFQRSITQV